MAFYAKHDPQALDRETVTWFDHECRSHWPKVFGALAMVAALDLDVYEELGALIDRLLGLEGRIEIALRQIDTDHAAAVQAVAEFLPAVNELLKTAPRELARIMVMAEAAQLG